MKKLYRLMLSAALFLSALQQTAAQGDPGENLMTNGGFEEWVTAGWGLKPVGWHIPTGLSPEKAEPCPGSKGAHSLKIWAYGGGILLSTEIPLTARQYKFSFWHKSSKANKVDIYLSWYKDGSLKRRELKYSVKTSEEWKQEEYTLEVPDDANQAGIRIVPKTDRSGTEVYLDDLVLTAGGSGTSSLLQAPENVKAATHQGELEISWKRPANIEGVQWEVVLEGRETNPLIVSAPTCLLTKLRPGTRYTVKVRTLKGTDHSDYTTLSTATEAMEESVESENRIPYLRTIEPAGSIRGRHLPLYYNELANPDATISYKLDGVVVTPIDNVLEFPPFEGIYKNFNLEIVIDEGGGRYWEILYNELSVRNVNN